MHTGFGPHGIITTAELLGTLVMLGLGLLAFAGMAYGTRRVVS